MTPTIVVVPVRDAIHHTRAFLEMIEEQAVEQVIVLDNGSRRPTRDLLRKHPVAHRLDAAGLGIYDMWNIGFGTALALARGEPVNVLMTNNDVLLPAGGVAALGRAVRSRADLWAVYPDYNCAWDLAARRWTLRYSEGVLGDGGLFGACFMLAGERIPWKPLVNDVSYEWWFGDNHLAREIRDRGGRQARLVGLPVAHVNEGTAREHPELAAMKARDRRRWIESERRRSTPAASARPARRVVPGTRVWHPRGARRPE
jgi:hypothetical protein